MAKKTGDSTSAVAGVGAAVAATAAPTLYRLEDDLAALLNSVELIPDEEQDARLQIFDEIAEKSAAALLKRDGTARYIRTLESMRKAVADEIKWLADRKKRIESHQERVEARVVRIIEQFAPERADGKSMRLEGHTFVLALRKNPDRTHISDEAAVPDHFKRITVQMPLDQWKAFAGEQWERWESKIDVPLKPVKEALDAGEDVPGADVEFGANRLEVK